MSRAILRLAAFAALFLVGAPASADDKAKDETPSEKVKKALDRPIDLDLKETSLAKVVERFREKTKLDITIGRSGGLMAIGLDPNADMAQPVEAKFKGTKVRDALRKVFEPFGLVPFIVDDAVLLTGEEAGVTKQLKQRVDVDVDDVPLAQALKRLGRRKAVNLVVDQKAAKQAEKKVSLQVEDVPLETAVRLLAEQAGMKAARIDNVLYVTTPEQAASIAAENRAATPFWPYNPYGPLFPAPGGVGLVGALGAFGVGGGVGGLGGGVIGVGGFGGIGGGIMGGPPRLPPPILTPPAETPKPVPPPAGSKPMGRVPVVLPSLAANDEPPADSPIERPNMWAWDAGRSPRPLGDEGDEPADL